MTDCDFSSGKCPSCGFVASRETRRNCPARNEGPPPPPPGLGDYVAAGLSSIGITKERVEAVVGGPCGCGGRQAAMNSAGAKYFGLPPGSTAPENKG
jgi:hypothetical protein